MGSGGRRGSAGGRPPFKGSRSHPRLYVVRGREARCALRCRLGVGFSPAALTGPGLCAGIVLLERRLEKPALGTLLLSRRYSG